MKKLIGWVPIIALIWITFQIYIATVSPLIAMLQRAIHLSFALALTFAVLRIGQKSNKKYFKSVDNLLILLSLSSGIYIYTQIDRLTSRIQFASELIIFDYFYGILIILLVLEGTRRAVGNALAILAAAFIGYAFLGPYLPGLLHHNAFDLKLLVEVMYFSNEGILGSPIAVSVDYVFYFILFAAFLEVTGAGRLFIDIAFKLTGKSKGGPAKAAVVASSGMGSISGSTVANVVSTGVFTIPLMKKVGYSPKFAASVEALSSNGGQILPPIMGAAAFLMANNLGLPYAEVALAAIIPAVLYYIALFAMVHFQAGKLGLGKVDDDSYLKLKEKQESIVGRIHLLLPLTVLIYLIFTGYTLQRAAILSLVLLIIISLFRKNTRINVKDSLEAGISGAKQSIQVAMPCAAAGIIVGVIVYSGLGLKFTELIISWSFGITVLSVLLVSIACIILGMGMPTASAYIMAAILLAPALQTLGFNPLSAHMFILYFAIFSMITPPVAIAVYSAASIAKSNPHETSLYAFYLGIPGFLIGYSLLINPSLLLIGEVGDIVWNVFTTIVGIIALTVSVIGYLNSHLGILHRILFLFTSIALIIPEGATDIIGLFLFLSLVILLHLKNKRSSNNTLENVV